MSLFFCLSIFYSQHFCLFPFAFLFFTLLLASKWTCFSHVTQVPGFVDHSLPPLPLASEPSLENAVELHLREQLRVYKEDFEKEKQERQRVQSELRELQLEQDQLKRSVLTAKNEIQEVKISMYLL